MIDGNPSQGYTQPPSTVLAANPVSPLAELGLQIRQQGAMLIETR